MKSVSKERDFWKTIRVFSGKYAFIILPALLFIIIRFVLDFNGLYGQDSYEYLRCSAWLSDRFHGHYTETRFFWPLAYPLAGSLLSFTGQYSVWALQLISLFTLSGSLWMSQKILLMVHPPLEKTIRIYILLCLLPAAYFLRAGYFVMSDMMASFLILSCIYYCLRYLQKLRRQDFILASLAAILAFFTRYASGIILFVPAIVILSRAIKNRHFIHLILGGLAGGLTAALFLWLKGDNAYGFLGHIQIEGWSFLNIFRSGFETVDGHSDYPLINLLYGLSVFVHPGYMMTGLVLIFFLKKADIFHMTQRLLILSLLVYLIFIMGMPFQNMRFLLPAFPLVFLWFFPAFVRAWEKLKRSRIPQWVVVIVLIAANLSLLIYSGQSFIRYNRMEREISARLVKDISADVPIYTFSIAPALKSYEVKNPLCNLWEQEYETFQSYINRSLSPIED